MSFLRLSWFMILSCCCTLSTFDIVKICSEEQLTLICQSTTHYQGQFLTWNVHIPHYNKSYSKSYSITGVRDLVSYDVEPAVMLSFDRISEPEVLPLIVQLSINNVSVNLNKTRIDCTECTADNILNNMQTIIHIINSNFEYPDSPQVQWMIEYFISNQDNATIILEWRGEAGVSYNVSAIPSPLGSKMISGNTNQLTVHYNTSYSVVVLATLCGQNMNMTAIDITIDYPGTCEPPLLNKSSGSSLYILDYSEPAVIGITILFNCSQSGNVLIGPNTTTCMADGQWVPDLNQLQTSCKVSCGTPETDENVHYLSYNSTLEGATVSFRCTDVPLQDEEFTSVCLKNASWIPDPVRQCVTLRLRLADCGPPPSPQNGHIVPYNSTLEGTEVTYVCWNVHQEENTSQCVEIHTTAICNVKGKWEPHSDDMCSVFLERSSEALTQDARIAVASSVTVFVITSILFFFVGFLSRHFCQKERKIAGNASPTVQPQIPYYDDVVLKQHVEQELELKENVAYAQPVLSQINN